MYCGLRVHVVGAFAVVNVVVDHCVVVYNIIYVMIHDVVVRCVWL